MSGPPLDGVRVLDVSGEMGAYGTRLLALAGADVLKVEPPHGDRPRRRPSFGAAPNQPSLAFAYYDAGKRGATVDLAGPTAQRRLRALAAGADVIVIAPSARSPVPGWDAFARTLTWAGPRAIICCLTSFGSGGPDDSLRATHLTSFAASGQMRAIGPPAGPPRGLPGQALYDELAAHAAAAVVAALRERPASGAQVVELSLRDMLAYRDSVAFGVYASTGVVYASREAQHSVPPSGIWEVKDGRVELLVYNPPHWDGFLELAGRPDELADAALRDRGTRGTRSAELAPVVASLLKDLTVEEIVSRAQQLRVPCSAQNLPDDVVTDQQMVSRGFWVEQHQDGIGTYRAPGLPFVSRPALLRLPSRPAPAVGDHDDEAGPAWAPGPPGRVPDGPRLADLKVVTFGTAIAGNVSATTLAEMGADVIKVESPARPDPLRAGPVFGLRRVFEPTGAETNLMFAAYSRSCRSVALDMKNAGARQVFLDLIARADILIDNFASGVMASWGLSHDQLAQHNPRLIMVTVSGYGRTGPRSHYMAYGANVNSFMGLTRAWAPHGTQFDYAAVAHVLFAAFAALAQRDRTGAGALIDIAQTEAGAALLAPLYLPALNPAAGPSAPGSVLTAVLPCAGEDEWIALELEDDTDLSAAAALLSGGGDMPGNQAGLDELEGLRAALANWAARYPAEQAMRRLQAAGLAAAAVRGTEEEFRDAQLWARGGVTRVDHPDLGPLLYPSPFQRFSATPVHIRRPSARLGQHTDEVIAEWLGTEG